MGLVRSSLEEQRGQVDRQAGYGAGGQEKQLDSQEEFGNGGTAMGLLKETADQVRGDQVWRQLDRQEWICTGGNAFEQEVERQPY